MPAAHVFCTPGICLASYLQPPRISRRPSILLVRQASVSLAPPHRFDQVAAAKLSSRIRTGSPLVCRRPPTSSCMTHAVRTIPKSSSRLIVACLTACGLTFEFALECESCIVSPVHSELCNESAFRVEACDAALWLLLFCYCEVSLFPRTERLSGLPEMS